MHRVARQLENFEREWYRLTEGEESAGEPVRQVATTDTAEANEQPREASTLGVTSDRKFSSGETPAADQPLEKRLAEKEELLRQIRRTGLPLEMPKDLPAILRESEEIRQELICLQTESAEIRRQLLEQKEKVWLLPLLLSLGLVATGMALGWWLGTPWKGLLGGLGLSIPGGYLGFRRLLRMRTARARLKGQGQVVEGRREEIQGRLAGLDARFEGVGMSPSAVEIVRMQKNLARYQELRERLREVEGALGVLEDANLFPGGVESDPEEPDSGDRTEGCDPVETGEAEANRLREVEAEGEKLHQRQKFLAGRLGYRMQVIGKVLGLASGETANLGASLERFVAELGEAWAGWSGQRYRSLRLDLDRRTVFLEKSDGTVVPREGLSEGVSSSLDLLARLTCALRQEARVMPWLILDDAFDGLDPARQLKTARLLEGAAREGRQVLVTSRDPAWLRLVRQSRWHVVDLDPTESISEPEPADKEADGDVRQLHLL